MEFKISLSKYPKLKEIKTEYLNEVIARFIDIGYNFEYNPESYINNHKELNTLYTITNQLVTSTHNLHGGLSSQRKGHIGEIQLDVIFKNRYNDLKYIKTNEINHSGDGWLIFPCGTKVIIESKNYNKTIINKKQIDKLKDDMIRNNINYSFLISYNSKIYNTTNDLDIIDFDNNYKIICISNFNNNLSSLDAGILLMKTFISSDNKFNNGNINNNIIINKFKKIINDDNIIINETINKNEKIIKMIEETNKILEERQTEKELIFKEYYNEYEKKLILFEKLQNDYNNNDFIHDIINCLINNDCTIVKNKKKWLINKNGDIIGSIDNNKVIIGKNKYNFEDFEKINMFFSN